MSQNETPQDDALKDVIRHIETYDVTTIRASTPMFLLARKIKGGVTVDIMGVDAFLPGSQIALRRVPNIDDLRGQTFEFKIIKLNKRRRNIVVSRRVILEGERERKRETLVKELLVGQVREGVVKNITDFGAFIDLGGLDGLLHITDISWGRVGHPSEVLELDMKLNVVVLDYDKERQRISLGYKQLQEHPWENLAERIVDAFGEKTLEVLDDDPRRLAEVDGIGKVRLDHRIHTPDDLAKLGHAIIGTVPSTTGCSSGSQSER